jgi:hypothetical protein
VNDVPRIVYRPRPDATTEGELNALVKVYRLLVCKCQQEEKATRSSGGREEGKDLHMKGDSDHDLNEGTIRSAEGARHGQKL